jgi:hypothetical protein
LGVPVGSVVLSGSDSYAGNTFAQGTLLYVDGTLSSTSIVDLLAGSELHGNGIIAAPVVTDVGPNVISPGHGSVTGVLTTGNVTFGSQGSQTFAVSINGPAVGAQYDQLAVNGTVALGTVCAFDIEWLGYAPPRGTEFTIIKNNGGSPISGTFVGLPEGSTYVVNSTTFQISYVGGSGHDVVLTVLSPWVPTSLAVDPAGNGVLEAGELVTLQPTWNNSSGSSAHLIGDTTNFTGPVGPTYSNPAASADYGTLADGASAACSTCYTIEITGSRPAQHWDATIEETVTPSATNEAWTLHVGESFPDVPTSQQFYRFIENLFHNGITGGCAGGNYCPDSSTTRAQIAVLLLKGEHGSGYLPPPCAGIFPDVPCPSQFTDWIEQLFAEGITAGCGGGDYCPSDPVTRAEMAAFLLKAEHGSGYVPPVCMGIFGDVACPSLFANWIEQLYNEGITGGCQSGPLLYCPGNLVTRGQMAVFLVKAFSLLLYAP